MSDHRQVTRLNSIVLNPAVVWFAFNSVFSCVLLQLKVIKNWPKSNNLIWFTLWKRSSANIYTIFISACCFGICSHLVWHQARRVAIIKITTKPLTSTKTPRISDCGMNRNWFATELISSIVYRKPQNDFWYIWSPPGQISASEALWSTAPINTLRPRQIGRHFTDDFFKCIYRIRIFEFRLKFHWSCS